VRRELVRVFDPDLVALLESGCALIIGTVAGDGAPHAGRAWGLTVVQEGAGDRVRLLLDAADPRSIEHARAGGRIAITGGDVRTLKSRQVKGRVIEVHDATDTDFVRADAYCEAFFEDAVETDGTPREYMERLRPDGYVACIVAIDEAYDQTPGPGAGAPVGAVAP
jgi:hypothetical protein